MIDASTQSRMLMYQTNGKSFSDFMKATSERFTEDEEDELLRFWDALSDELQSLPKGEQIQIPGEWA